MATTFPGPTDHCVPLPAGDSPEVKSVLHCQHECFYDRIRKCCRCKESCDLEHPILDSIGGTTITPEVKLKTKQSQAQIDSVRQRRHCSLSSYLLVRADDTEHKSERRQACNKRPFITPQPCCHITVLEEISTRVVGRVYTNKAIAQPLRTTRNPQRLWRHIGAMKPHCPERQ